MAFDSKYGEVDIKGVPDDEPVFILRGQDLTATVALQMYSDIQIDHAIKESVSLTIKRFQAWGTKKMPD